MQIPGRTAVTFRRTTASHFSGMEVTAEERRPCGKPQPSLGAECLFLVILGLFLSICFCSCGLSTRLMAEGLQRRTVGCLPHLSWAIALAGPLEMRGIFLRSLAWTKNQSRSSKQPYPFQGWVNQHKVRIHKALGSYVNWAQPKKQQRLKSFNLW